MGFAWHLKEQKVDWSADRPLFPPKTRLENAATASALEHFCHFMPPKAISRTIELTNAELAKSQEGIVDQKAHGSCRVFGLDFIGMVKTATANFPKRVLWNARGNNKGKPRHARFSKNDTFVARCEVVANMLSPQSENIRGPDPNQPHMVLAQYPLDVQRSEEEQKLFVTFRINFSDRKPQRPVFQIFCSLRSKSSVGSYPANHMPFFINLTTLSKHKVSGNMNQLSIPKNRFSGVTSVATEKKQDMVVRLFCARTLRGTKSLNTGLLKRQTVFWKKEVEVGR
eukprot:g42052.t1